MNLVEKFGPIAARNSISQYCPPRCFELAGKAFDFVMDTGECSGDIHLEFVDESKVNWSIMSGKFSGTSEHYECRKADDYTYLVTFCMPEPNRENQTYVIDKEQGLVTFMRCVVGENPYWPYLIDTHFAFGYIKIEGEEHTDIKRHTFTDEVAGTGVRWVYGHELSTVHVYYNSHFYRIKYSNQANVSTLSSGMRSLPGSDEQAFYVKIKEGMYLVSVTEQNMEKILGAKMGFRSDTLCFLDNWNRMYSVGRGYGTATRENTPDREIFCMIGKYAKPEEIEEHFFTDPNPYTV